MPGKDPFRDDYYEMPIYQKARHIFQMVASFDPWDYIIDRWGLFNPPGVGPDDKDPDDDLFLDNFDIDLD